MNIRKGLSRLFLVGLVLSAIVGFIVGSKASEGSTKFSIQTINTIRSELLKPICIKALKIPVSEWNQLEQSGCVDLSIYFDSLNTFQKKNSLKYSSITSELVSEMIWIQIKEQQQEYLLLGLGGTIGLYILLCVLGLVIFFTGRWIKRGFNS